MLNYHAPQQQQQPQRMQQLLSSSISNTDNFYYPQMANMPALTLQSVGGANCGGSSVRGLTTSASSLDQLHSMTQHNAFAGHNCNNNNNDSNSNAINMSPHQAIAATAAADRIAVGNDAVAVAASSSAAARCGSGSTCSPDELTKIEDNYPLHVDGSKHSENVKRFSVNNLLELANDCRISGKLQHQHQQQEENVDGTQINDL
ncbi:PREDICTED: uncharacterized protein LOC108375545, partial [Rhagoletis zephyria]|uniref:uncharacterized protein LOC108375545 n=1 Tax=Rhagoletis zephyria TaxID=28612 RepID=UPI0008113190